MDPRKQYLNNLVLKAKIGNKKAFEELYRMHYFILNHIFQSYKTIYKFLRGNEFEAFQRFYIFFWEIISSYKLDSDISFSRHLKINMIRKYQRILMDEFRLPKHLIAKEDMIERLINNKEQTRKNLKRRRKFMNCLRAMTGKQLQAFYYKAYRKKNIEEIADILGLGYYSSKERLAFAYKKIRDSYHGLRNNNKKRPRYEEKMYYAYRVKEGVEE